MTALFDTTGRRLRLVLLMSACAVWLISPKRSLAADDEIPVPESQSATPTIPPSDTEPAAKSAAPEDSANDTEGEDDSDSLEQATRHVQQALRAMQAARQRIEQSDTGTQTQQLQEQAVQNLERVLEIARQQQKKRGSQSQQNSSTQSKPSGSQQKSSGPPERQNGQQKSAGKNSDNGDTTGSPTNRRRAGEDGDAEDRADVARIPAAELARRRQAIKDVWGHLPPHVRDAMLNNLSEKYLPKYEDLVKKYYEELAEKNRKRNGK
ncbi:MAG: hypothetical protein JSS02_30340 [Planctomycetes bacterium]|nr:hypothetical protein [Planctomycetota bacterium]